MQQLILDDNALSDRGALALAAAIRAPDALPCLTGLWMERTGVGEAGRRALAEAVQSTGREIDIEWVL